MVGVSAGCWEGGAHQRGLNRGDLLAVQGRSRGQGWGRVKVPGEAGELYRGCAGQGCGWAE